VSEIFLVVFLRVIRFICSVGNRRIDRSAVVEADHGCTAAAVVGIHAELDDACRRRGRILDAEGSLAARAPHNVQQGWWLWVGGSMRRREAGRRGAHGADVADDSSNNRTDR
jgi:hypothetical protein